MTVLEAGSFSTVNPTPGWIILDIPELDISYWGQWHFLNLILYVSDSEYWKFYNCKPFEYCLKKCILDFDICTNFIFSFLMSSYIIANLSSHFDLDLWLWKYKILL